MRPIRWLPALLCALGVVAGCQPAQHHVLMRVHSLSDVSNIQVLVLALDSGRRHEERVHRVDLSAAELAQQPIHLTVDLTHAQSSTVLIHLHATTPAGEHLYATRCYPVHGVIVDDVLLFGPLGALDIDGDGFVTDPSAICRELGPDGEEKGCEGDAYVCEDRYASDCSEGNSSIHPGARTFCQDGIDQDCDGMDEPCGDFDGDGYPACGRDVTEGCDCDDGLATINPGAFDVCNDGIDQDCSGADACCDNDGDGVEQCLDGYPDCDDDNPDIPAPFEVCNGIDDNCNRLIDELDECRGPDLDGDGVRACGFEDPGDPCDCNDCDPSIHPGAREICGNTIDENCDGMLDVGCLPNDADGDGADADHDCDDNDPLFFPPSVGREAIDRCGDGKANNCVPGEDTSCEDDVDGDGWVEPEECEGNPDIRPDADEICNGIDDDCDGKIDEGLSSGPESGCANGTPVTFLTDFTHCGSCRRACDTVRNDACADGGCLCMASGMECGDPASSCCGAAGCVDLMEDENHCGQCNNACGLGETCVAGRCTCGTQPPAPLGQDACPDDGSESNVCCGGACRDVTSDAAHCGVCGHECGPNAQCTGGTCSCVSPMWQDCNNDLSAMVSDGCEVNVLGNDVNHCGSCTNVCQGGQAVWQCNSGSCAPMTCIAPFADCNGAPGDGCEINTNTNTAHCGACNAGCSGGNATWSCVGGACVPTCNSGFANCDGNDANGCETRIGGNDVNNCGGCGVRCSGGNANWTCNAGTCVPTCQPGFGNCDGVASNGCEVNLLVDEAHCGTCTTVCSGQNAMWDCVSGSCTVTGCSLPFANCDMNPANGCEINTRNNVNHCGGCMMACSGMNASWSCASGACAVASCSPGFADCDSSPVTGCETDIRNDVDHCGSCTTSCSGMNANWSCTSGACTVASCAMGFRDCDSSPTNGCEIDTRNDVDNCGGCGIMCAPGESCENGSCRCGTSPAGPVGGGATCTGGANTCCGSTCRDLRNDPDHCGACGDPCGAGESCAMGTCQCGDTTATGTGPACASGQTCCNPDGPPDRNECVEPSSC